MKEIEIEYPVHKQIMEIKGIKEGALPVDILSNVRKYKMKLVHVKRLIYKQSDVSTLLEDIYSLDAYICEQMKAHFVGKVANEEEVEVEEEEVDDIDDEIIIPPVQEIKKQRHLGIFNRLSSSD